MAKKLLCCTLVFGFVFLTIFLIASLASLSYNEVGLNYSTYFKSVENKTYSNGIHFIGLGHEFIKYPLNV